MSLYTDLKALGVPVDHHESDLYVQVTAESRRLVDAHPYRSNVTTFRADDGTLWYDVPFAFDPFWEHKR